MRKHKNHFENSSALYANMLLLFRAIAKRRDSYYDTHIMHCSQFVRFSTNTLYYDDSKRGFYGPILCGSLVGQSNWRTQATDHRIRRPVFYIVFFYVLQPSASLPIWQRHCKNETWTTTSFPAQRRTVSVQNVLFKLGYWIHYGLAVADGVVSYI